MKYTSNVDPDLAEFALNVNKQEEYCSTEAIKVCKCEINENYTQLSKQSNNIMTLYSVSHVIKIINGHWLLRF